ncbi:hypothetical protein B4113_0381 [Geobacillus sp. B4113_201601]|nr:hypothetical protein B4113_0381 [Geobacillus sp. B4113_201601]
MRPKAVSQPATGAVRQRGKHRAGGRVFNVDTAEKRAHSPFAPGIALPKRVIPLQPRRAIRGSFDLVFQ